MARDRVTTELLTLIVPGDPDQPTGGYRYDARIASELRALGWTVDVIGLPGRFPEADDEARSALDSALRALPDSHLAVLDGLALAGLPAVACRHARRLALVALVHHPLADETGLPPALREHFLQTEPRALAACRRIVTTSEFTARRLVDLGVHRDRIRVVAPGVDSARPSQAWDPARHHLLCVGSLVRRKGQDVLIEALAGLQDFPWMLDLVGDPKRDPVFAASLRSAVNKHGLQDRIGIRGVQDTHTLDATYHAADLLVVPSHYEGYGMVVTEALARALPIIATSGGALADTVPPEAGLQVPAGDSSALADALRRWFSEPGLRAEKRAGAHAARHALTDWVETGRCFAQALARLDEEPAP